jgi:starvation-inducible DNA-binding protein
MDIGIDPKSRRVITEALARVLADTFILSLKVRNYHWNVTGPHFNQLHALFQEIYENLDDSGDRIAERIRTLGHKAPGSYAEFMSISALKEEIGAPGHTEMIQKLLSDTEQLIRRLDEVKDTAIMKKDDATADVVIQQLGTLGKFAWMLRNYLEQ